MVSILFKQEQMGLSDTKKKENLNPRVIIKRYMWLVIN